MVPGRKDEINPVNVPCTARLAIYASDDNALLTKHSMASKSRGSSVPPRRKTHERNPEQTCFRASQSAYSDRFTRLSSEQDRSSSTQKTTPNHVGSSVPPKQAQRRDKALKQDSNSVSSKVSRKSIKNKTLKCSSYVVDCATKSTRNSTSKTRFDAKSISSQSDRFTSKSTGETALSVATKKSKKTSKRRNKDIDEGATRNTQASKRSIFTSATERIKRMFGVSSRQKKNHGTDETSLSTPMDVLNIPVDHMSGQDLPAFVMGEVETNEPGHHDSDQSLTLGTPKRDRKMSRSESESSTPMSCLNVPTVDMSERKISPVKSEHNLQSRKSKSHKRNDDGMEVFDLPWTNGILYGKYSGPINTSLQPHGKGTLKISGVWENGELTFPEVNGPRANAVSRDTQTAISISSAKANKHIIIPATPCCKIEDEPTAPLTTISDGTYLSDKHDSLDKSSSSRLSRSNVSSSSTEAPDRSTKFSSKLCHTVHLSSKPHQKYHIGEVARSPNDMIIHRSYFDAIDSVSLIQKMQHAFIKRSNGLWTCAVLVERALQPINGKHWYSEREIENAGMKLEESMLFAINDDGSTKIVNKRNWGKFVRRMKTNMDDDCDGLSDRNGDSRTEDVTGKGDPVDDDSEEDADLVEDDQVKGGIQHTANDYGKEVVKTSSCAIQNKTIYKNETSNETMDCTREFQNKRGIGDHIEQNHVPEQYERDTLETTFEDKIICSKNDDEKELFVRKSTGTASTSLTWSSLSNSTSLSNSMLLSKSMLNDID
eukprot:CCRYP_013552-RA/>CCRYP_013552-RA protein AED:0.07 eAED:0.07 QI:0/-1/0/1/-1/1/1/0/768